jgi:threonine 3-dehydrogenase
MLAVAKTTPERGVEVIEVGVPRIGPDEVLIQVAVAAICGGDLKIYRWDPDAMKKWSRLKTFAFPRILGHELSGTITEVGREVVGLGVGDKVAVESHVPCGRCEFCRSGRQHLCAQDRLVGVGLDGGFAEYAALPAHVVVKIPDELSFEQAALLEPLGVALHAVEVSGLVVGDRVAVLGCGAVGLYTALLANAGGASRIVTTDVSPSRTELASSLGLEAVLNEGGVGVATERILGAFSGQRAHVVFDAAGSPTTVGQALAIAATSGCVVLIGTFRGAGLVDTSTHVVHREITVTGISGRQIFATWERLLNIVGAGLLDPTAVVTHRFPLTEAPEAFALAGAGKAGKVLLLPRSG